MIKYSSFKKPKVMQHFIASQVNNGGPATGALLLINSYLKNSFEFVPLKQTYAPKGVNIRLLIDFYKTIKKHKPDVLHIRGLHSEGFYGLLAGKLAGCKNVVVSVHGLYSDDSNVKGFKKWLFLKIIEPLTLRYADMVYCVCDYAAKRPIIVNNTSNLYGYIYNAAPDYTNINRKQARLKIRKEFNIDSDDILAISVGRITVDKGFEVLLQSMKDLNKSHKNLKFLIVGKGDYLEVIQKAIEDHELNNVILTGKRSDIPELLFASDLFVFPTLHENLSNALLEASAASLPIIATNVGGNPEVIKNNVTGILVESNNVKEITENISLLSKDSVLRKRLGSAALTNSKQVFSKKIIFDQIANLYNSML